MDTLSSVKARVRALRRKLARELALLRLRRLAEEHCLQSSVAQADRQAPPDSYAFILRVAAVGFRLSTFMAAHKYLERCRDNNALPDRENLVRALIPWSRNYPLPGFY